MMSESLADNTANCCHLLACLAPSTRRYRVRRYSHKKIPNKMSGSFIYLYHFYSLPKTTSKTTHTFLETAHLHSSLLIRLEYRREA
jgi:hypothetical protein